MRSRYCCCRSIFEGWNVENIFSNMSSSVLFSPHNFNFELILKSAELYSATLLKSCSLKLIHSYLALGRITDFWCSYLFLRLFHRINGSFIVRYSVFNSSWRWWRIKIIGLARSCWDSVLPSLIFFQGSLPLNGSQHLGSMINNSCQKYQGQQIQVKISIY